MFGLRWSAEMTACGRRCAIVASVMSTVPTTLQSGQALDSSCVNASWRSSSSGNSGARITSTLALPPESAVTQSAISWPCSAWSGRT